MKRKEKSNGKVEPIGIDFRELSTGFQGERLEQLIRLLALKMDMDVEWAGRGSDGGRDLIIIEEITGPISKEKIRWLVQCKDRVQSGKSVHEGEIPDISDKVIQHGTSGFLLVTTTTVSSALKEKMDSMDKGRGGKIKTLIWDACILEQIILRSGNQEIFRQFFPDSYKRLHAIKGPLEAMHVLRAFLPPEGYGKVQNVLENYIATPTPYLTSAVNTPVDIKKMKIDIDTIKMILRGDDIEGAAVASLILPEADFMSIVRDLDYTNYQKCEEFLKIVIIRAADPIRILNSYQYLVENHEVTMAQRAEFATYLNNDGLEVMFGDQFEEWFFPEMINNGSQYGVYDKIQELSSNTVIENIDITELIFRAEGRTNVKFSGTFTMDLELNFDSEPIGNYTCSGSFEGEISEDGFLLDEVKVDTSDFFGE